MENKLLEPPFFFFGFFCMREYLIGSYSEYSLSDPKIEFLVNGSLFGEEFSARAPRPIGSMEASVERQDAIPNVRGDTS